jgi:hypothetical protein
LKHLVNELDAVVPTSIIRLTENGRSDFFLIAHSIYGVHPTNTVLISSILPWDRKRMLRDNGNGTAEFELEAFLATLRRSSL